MDRYGGYIDKDGVYRDKGKFFSPEGAPFESRALPESATEFRNYYEVVKPIPGVQEGQAIPWFGQPGMGTQYQTQLGVQDLIDGGYIRRLP